jgi:hypothetical protein
MRLSIVDMTFQIELSGIYCTPYAQPIPPIVSFSCAVGSRIVLLVTIPDIDHANFPYWRVPWPLRISRSIYKFGVKLNAARRDMPATVAPNAIAQRTRQRLCYFTPHCTQKKLFSQRMWSRNRIRCDRSLTAVNTNAISQRCDALMCEQSFDCWVQCGEK